MSVTQEPFECRVRVRYAECDAMGLLHHARYLEYFEYARTEALRARGLCYRDLEERGVLFVVVSFSCRYRKPVRYDDLVTIRTTVQRMTTVRVEHRYEILRDDALLCEATSTLACVDRTGRPQQMPPAMWGER